MEIKKSTRIKLIVVSIILVCTVLNSCIVKSTLFIYELRAGIKNADYITFCPWDGENYRPDYVEFKKGDEAISLLSELFQENVSIFSVPELVDPFAPGTIDSSIVCCGITIRGDKWHSLTILKNFLTVRSSTYIKRHYLLKDRSMLKQVLEMVDVEVEY